MTESAPGGKASIALERNDQSDSRRAKSSASKCASAENDELLIKGPNVMLGYWRRPEDTRRVLEPDGWLHTGDQARLSD